MDAECDFLVIGGGIAGLSYALEASKRGRVVLITKDRLPESNTAYAQGGIASVWSPEDSFASHQADTLDAGADLSHPDVVEMVVTEGPERIRDLIALGTNFSVSEGSPGNEDRDYDLTREGGHSHRRVLHATDATGWEIVRSLIAAVRATESIEVLEQHDAIDLLVRDGVCWGAYVLVKGEKTVRTFTGRTTLLATGGAGKAYLYTSNPDIATGDGVAMAFRAGAPIANMEFFQFHPTCLFHPKAKSFLLTEALRGEGAVLRLPNGKAFMEDHDPRGELAPRDIVARAIDHEMKLHGFEHVYLDISHREPDWIRERFPTVAKRCAELGLDLTSEPMPVVPAAHYCCGGIVVDRHGRTPIDRLYACGEVTMTGLHGANRLASNSLLEALVFAHRAATDAITRCGSDRSPIPSLAPWNPGSAVDSDESVVVTQNWEEIRRFLWNYVGIVRTDRRLARARKRIHLLEREIDEYYWNFIVTSDLIELRNLAVVAELIIESAIRRRESRGLHFNRDCPQRDDLNWKRDTVLTREDLAR